MSNKVVLLDLEHNLPTAALLRDILEHYASLYIFNAKGNFEFALSDLTELATWISCGQVVVLDTLAAKEKEFEYAVIVGQLLALLEANVHIDVISAMPSSPMLVEMLNASDLDSHLIQIPDQSSKQSSVAKGKQRIPTVATILDNPQLQWVKKYCDHLAHMSGKPNTLDKLKNSVANILKLDTEQSQHVVGMLINLKIVKYQDQQLSFRKKVLKQWAQLDLNTVVEPVIPAAVKVAKVDALLAKLQVDAQHIMQQVHADDSIQNIQSGLFKNFEKIDPVQMEVIQKLNQMKSNKPKDIYELRDLLEHMFPKSDVRLLLKELIEKGYIYWNGHAVIYSHEMFLN